MKTVRIGRRLDRKKFKELIQDKIKERLPNMKFNEGDLEHIDFELGDKIKRKLYIGDIEKEIVSDIAFDPEEHIDYFVDTFIESFEWTGLENANMDYFFIVNKKKAEISKDVLKQLLIVEEYNKDYKVIVYHEPKRKERLLLMNWHLEMLKIEKEKLIEIARKNTERGYTSGTLVGG